MSSGRLVRRLRRIVIAAVVVLAATACEVRTEVNLTVADDGSGVVEVAVGLDDRAAERLSALGELELSDLETSGWEVLGPAQEADGREWLRVRHSFTSPTEIGPLVDQVAGEQVFRDFTVVRSDAFAESTWRFDGVVDFSEGPDTATDDDIDAALEEAGVGVDALTLISERLGGIKDEQLRFQVAVRLPGSVRSNAPTQASNGAIWRPSITDRSVLDLHAEGVVSRTGRLVWLGVALAAGLALVLMLAVRVALFARARRARSSPDSP